jgi:hypothetical protein
MSTEPDVLDISVEGYVSEKECGHYSFGVEIDLCLTEQEADRACCMLQQLLAANMGFVLGKDLTMESAEVVPPAGSMMN